LAAGHNPTWSPDGRRLAFIDNYTLFTIGRNGKGRRRVSRDTDFVLGAAWSPKSRMFGYLAGTTTNAADGFSVETVSADGKRVHVLTRVPAPTYIWGSPVWTRDGRRILVAVDSP
jgi:Tol biopolymer transport system component